MARFDTTLMGDDSLIWSTKFGGTADDEGRAVAVGDPSGGLAIAGVTLSPDLPVTPGAFQTFHANVESNDAFVMKFSELADIAIPLPDGPSITYYPLLAFSVLRPGPSECRPLGEIQLTRSTLHAQMALPMLQAPANVFLALYDDDEPLPEGGSNNQHLLLNDDTYFINSQDELEKSMTPWMKGIADPVSQLLSLDVQALRIDESYLNLAVIAQAAENQSDDYYAWITQIPVPRNQLEQAHLSLQALLAVNQSAESEALQQAVADLQESLKPEYWLNPWTLDDKLGRQALEAQERAVQGFVQAQSQLQEISKAIADVLKADDTLVAYAVVDAVARGGDPQQIQKARESLIKAGKELADEDFLSAIHDYVDAWTQAEEAS